MTAGKRATKANSGSPTTGEPEYLVIGMLRRPHGLRGEILMDVLTDFPERIKPGTRVFVGSGHMPRIISGCRVHAQGLLVSFKDIVTREAVGALRNLAVYVLSADRPSLQKGQYYHHELLGSTIVDEDQGSIGILAEILQTGANDVYVVERSTSGELLLPAIPGVLLEIDLPRHMIRVRVPEGLEPNAES